MEKLTEDFICAIKRGKISAKQSAIDFMSDYTGSPKEEYTDYVLLPIVQNFFLDYIKTGNAWELMFHFFDHKKITRHCKAFADEWDYPQNDLMAMLSALQMVRVMKDGIFINGFTERVGDQ